MDAYGFNLEDYQKGKISFSPTADYHEVQTTIHKPLDAWNF